MEKDYSIDPDDSSQDKERGSFSEGLEGIATEIRELIDCADTTYHTNASQASKYLSIAEARLKTVAKSYSLATHPEIEKIEKIFFAPLKKSIRAVRKEIYFLLEWHVPQKIDED